MLLAEKCNLKITYKRVLQLAQMLVGQGLPELTLSFKISCCQSHFYAFHHTPVAWYDLFASNAGSSQRLSSNIEGFYA